jgi:SM-20-related protein
MIEKVLRELKEEGWSFNPGFFNSDELRIFNEFFDRYKEDFLPAKVGKGGLRVEEIRGDHTLWLDPFNIEPIFVPVMKLLENFKHELNKSLYLGLKDFESHLVYYRPGTYYKEHSDRFENDSSRTLSFTFYLHEIWTPDDGGELVLYSKDGKTIKTILPTPGSFMCFMSDEFPHEVKVSQKERRSLTGWMHTKIIY